MTKRTKIIIDLLAAIPFIYLLIIFPILMHNQPDVAVVDGRLVPMVKLVIASIIPAIAGATWLVFRHGEYLAKQYPLIFVRYGGAIFVFGMPLMYFITYFILKNTVWRS